MRARTWIIVIVAALILPRAAGIASGAWNAHKVGVKQAGSAITVHVRPRPRVHQNVHVRFRSPGPLPHGGYYYAVIVLKPYKHYTSESPPPCSTSSDMLHTEYGYPHRHRVRLTLAPAPSAHTHWCPGGHYIGAVYAVPEAPPCEGKYPCRTSESYEPPPSPSSFCWEIEPGQVACGVVITKRFYQYPEGLPKPRGGTAHIIARFGVKF